MITNRRVARLSDVFGGGANGVIAGREPPALVLRNRKGREISNVRHDVKYVGVCIRNV